MSTPRPAANLDALVPFLLREPGLLDRLLAQHVDDGRGRCRVCSSAGIPHMWPCTIRGYAELAAEAKQRNPPRPAASEPARRPVLRRASSPTRQRRPR